MGSVVDTGQSADKRPSKRVLLVGAARRWWRRARALARSGELSSLLRMLAGGLRRRSQDITPVDTALFRRDRYLHRTRTGALPKYQVLPFSLPAGVERAGAASFVVAIDKVTTYAGFSLADAGWHPFEALLRQYQADPALRYEDSVLRLLYERLTPTTVAEAVFGDAEHALSPLDRMPASHEVMKSLWQLDARQVQQLAARVPQPRSPDDKSRYFGPKTPAGGAVNFEKVLALHDSIAKHGYDPDTFGGTLPRGFFLVRDGDYRFVMSRGNRRLPVLKVLGTSHVLAAIRVHHPPVVDESALARWSTAAGGPYPSAVAERLFDQMFTTIGLERAAALGLA